MEDDINDIDFIDRYLNNELSEAEQKQFKERYLIDVDFKKEVEVYRKIYTGIQQTFKDEALKQKLNNYYDDYKQENLRPAIIKPIFNWRKTAIIITGIAASICLFIGIWYKNKNVLNNKDIANNKINKKDTLIKSDTGKNVIVNKGPVIISPLDSGKINKIKPVKDAYAFDGQKRLPATAIREATYPQPLRYTLNQGLLTLYGDPLLGLIKLNIYKKNGKYYLLYDGAIYKLIQTNELKPLEQQQTSIADNGTESGETVQVQIAPLQTTMLPATRISVVIASGSGKNGFYFTTEKGNDLLVLEGDFDADNCMVVALKKEDVEKWYLVYGPKVYFLDEQVHQLAPLKELSGLESQEARLFVKRNLVVKSVMLLK